MISNDKQMGTPFVDYTDTKANIEALPSPRVGAHAVATDNPTAPFGVYTPSNNWHWYSTGSGEASLAFQDEGVPLGTPGTVNFVGDNVSVTISGSVARVYVTGSSGASTHNSLSGLQGGTANEYYHLSSGTYLRVTSSRDVLTADRTYYVRTDGSNSNNGLTNTADGAFLTIQKAIDVAAALDLSIYNVTIQVADGTYTGAVVCKTCVGAGTVTIQGNNSTPANVHINVTGVAITASLCKTKYLIKDLKVSSTNIGIYSVYGSFVELYNLDFGASSNAHIAAVAGGVVNISSSYAISGAAANHIQAVSYGTYTAYSVTITITGTPAFTTFALAQELSFIQAIGITFSGSATGTRYSASTNSVINTAGGGANYFPGNAAGSTATGGQYV